MYNTTSQSREKHEHLRKDAHPPRYIVAAVLRLCVRAERRFAQSVSVEEVLWTNQNIVLVFRFLNKMKSMGANCKEHATIRTK
ncbi:hypothetical protein A2454_02455 [Candidatus Peribacteria bacterium RIFOXYC2_FULL_55_14]|nr:MAG: hypothetical protein A2198_05855 [Candidatus Peribacteria bacterium RIFOXYA1_FULL_56_14]OGJ74359.1 MAG: hypothetical protein A2384_06550 [Candidatus Peribacteria bacterium RIFOXYB1_FULL_54_35]OGJ75106.1 MAG: hypothetical protein A2217_05250 [Candidatus Peribacteria bacterium RIFOXYA2_FULL_55_28]OGJ75977.1 MAG: hypothetical protein A2327_03695 [Candidatus Peribacteria bacterium RIFOXYB2_FULL_54_17]OGJ77467.1 MAG: hypothetical protein A2424_03890 [Candidatus Peribacteria bacterium RIFOXYC